MKKLTTLILILLISGYACDDQQQPTSTITPVPAPTPTPGYTPEVINTPTEPTEPGEPAPDPTEFYLKTGSALYRFDGTNLILLSSGKINHLSENKFMVNDTITEYSPDGTVSDTWLHGFAPDHAIYLGDDLYTFKTQSKQDSLNLGGLYKIHTRTYINGVEQGNWWENQYDIQSITAHGDDLYITKTGYNIITTPNDLTLVKYVSDNFVIYKYDSAPGRAYIHTDDEYPIDIVPGLHLAEHWQKAAGVWYSGNGFEFNESDGLSSEANLLHGFNAWPTPLNVPWLDQTYVIGLGVFTEHNEEVTYWLDAASGRAFKHIPSLDNIVEIGSLYVGESTREYGINKYREMNVFNHGNKIYYYFNGGIYCFDMDSNMNYLFYAGVGELVL